MGINGHQDKNQDFGTKSTHGKNQRILDQMLIFIQQVHPLSYFMVSMAGLGGKI